MKTTSILSILTMITCVTLFTACDPTPKHESSTEVAEDQNEQNEQISNNLDDESDFLVEAASGGIYEVELGKLAQQKAQTQAVKDFGTKMVTDHGMTNEKLKTLAASKGITIPATMSNKEQKDYDKLKDDKAADFDKDYIDQMVKDHKKDVDAFEKAAKNLDDPDVKAFAANTLPTLKEHLTMAQQIQDKKNL